MIIYFAATAPGNEAQRERGMINLENRLLSYFLISHNMFECGNVFEKIKHENLLCLHRTRKRNASH